MIERKQPLLLAALLTSLAAAPVLAEGLVDSAKEAGHAVGKGAHDVGMSAKEIGKKILDSGAETGKEIGHKAADAGKEVGKAAKEGAKALLNGIKGEGS
jgi:hypothetical protein